MFLFWLGLDTNFTIMGLEQLEDLQSLKLVIAYYAFNPLSNWINTTPLYQLVVCFLETGSWWETQTSRIYLLHLSELRCSGVHLSMSWHLWWPLSLGEHMPFNGFGLGVADHSCCLLLFQHLHSQVVHKVIAQAVPCYFISNKFCNCNSPMPKQIL